MSDLDKMIQEALVRFEKLPPEERIRIREAQRKSWVVGEMMLEHPEMTREHAEAIYDKMIAGWY